MAKQTVRLAAALMALALSGSAACSKGPKPEPAWDEAPQPSAAPADAPPADEAPSEPKALFDLPEEFAERARGWTGDLDGMIARRALRLLVTYNSTHYFVDRAEQGGVTFEAGRLLEQALRHESRIPARSHEDDAVQAEGGGGEDVEGGEEVVVAEDGDPRLPRGPSGPSPVS